MIIKLSAASLLLASFALTNDVHVSAFVQPTGKAEASIRHYPLAATRASLDAPAAMTVSLGPTSFRDVNQLQEWAAQCGVVMNNGFGMAQDPTPHPPQQYMAVAGAGGNPGDVVLSVPANMILSSVRIQQEYQQYTGEALQNLQRAGYGDAASKFNLFVRLLVEFEAGTNSPYYQWLNGMPREFTTGVAMDEFCLDCLPPYLYSMCQRERNQLTAFKSCLQPLSFLKDSTKDNEEVLKWVFNLASTRSVPNPNNPDDLQIVPMVDMCNDNSPPNAQIQFDEQGNCFLSLVSQVQQGEPLYVSTVPPTNPAKTLAKFGFLPQNMPEGVYCKLAVSNPSEALKQVGYNDPSQLLVATADGQIAPGVWDVFLVSAVLESDPNYGNDLQGFVNAHLQGDANAKNGYHQKYFALTHKALSRHVQSVLDQVEDLKSKTLGSDASRHPRLPLIQRHNDWVLDTFRKVQMQLQAMGQ